MIANEVGQKILKSECTAETTAEEFYQCVRQARDVLYNTVFPTILASGRSAKTTTEQKTKTNTEAVDQHLIQVRGAPLDSSQERTNQNQTQEEVREAALDAFQKWTRLKQTLGGHGRQEEVQSKTKSSESIDYRKVGVRQCASGKWVSDYRVL